MMTVPGGHGHQIPSTSQGGMPMGPTNMYMPATQVPSRPHSRAMVNNQLNMSQWMNNNNPAPAYIGGYPGSPAPSCAPSAMSHMSMDDQNSVMSMSACSNITAITGIQTPMRQNHQLTELTSQPQLRGYPEAPSACENFNPNHNMVLSHILRCFEDRYYHFKLPEAATKFYRLSPYFDSVDPHLLATVIRRSLPFIFRHPVQSTERPDFVQLRRQLLYVLCNTILDDRLRRIVLSVNMDIIRARSATPQQPLEPDVASVIASNLWNEHNLATLALRALEKLLSQNCEAGKMCRLAARSGTVFQYLLADQIFVQFKDTAAAYCLILYCLNCLLGRGRGREPQEGERIKSSLVRFTDGSSHIAGGPTGIYRIVFAIIFPAVNACQDEVIRDRLLSRALSLLADVVDVDNRSTDGNPNLFVAQGGVQCVCQMMRPYQEDVNGGPMRDKIVENGTYLITLVCDAPAVGTQNLDKEIEQLVNATVIDNLTIRKNATGCFVNLIANRPNNKAVLIQNRGFEFITHFIAIYAKREKYEEKHLKIVEEIVENSLMTLTAMMTYNDLNSDQYALRTVALQQSDFLKGLLNHLEKGNFAVQHCVIKAVTAIAAAQPQLLPTLLTVTDDYKGETIVIKIFNSFPRLVHAYSQTPAERRPHSGEIMMLERCILLLDRMVSIHRPLCATIADLFNRQYCPMDLLKDNVISKEEVCANILDLCDKVADEASALPVLEQHRPLLGSLECNRNGRICRPARSLMSKLAVTTSGEIEPLANIFAAMSGSEQYMMES